MNIAELIENGMRHLANNEKAIAQGFFKQALQQDKDNETAWILISKTVESKKEQAICLKQALRINPNNQAVKLELQLLTIAPSSPPSPVPAQSNPIPIAEPSPAKPESIHSVEVIPTPAINPPTSPLPNLASPDVRVPSAPINPPQIITHKPANFAEAEKMAEQLARQSVAQERGLPPRENVCPVCRRSDAIRRVLSIVQEGTHHTTGSQTTTSETDLHGKRHYWGQNDWHLPSYQGSSNISGSATTHHTTDINLTRQTELAELLASPPVPEEPKLRDSSCVDLLMMIGIPITAIVVALIALFTNQRNDIFGRSHLDASNLLWFPAILVIGELLLQIAWRGPAIRSAKKQHAVEMHLYEKNELVPWREKMVAWEKLFYCMRDHVVYEPVSAEYCDPSQLSSLLEKLIQRR